MGFPGGSDGKASACNAGDLGSIPWSERSPGEGNGNPLQYSCLKHSMDGGAWWATVHAITKSHTRLNDWAAATKIHTQNLALKFISDNNVKISILLRVWYQLIILSNANWISFYFLYMVHEFQHKHDEWFGSVIWLPQALCHSQIHLYNSNQWIRTIKVKPMTAKSYW